MENFNVTAMELANFSREKSSEFLEVYRGVVPDFIVIFHSTCINNKWFGP